LNTRVFLLVLALGAAPGVFAQALPELDLKATYAYNFAALTQWPPTARTSFNFCVLGDEGVAEAMRRLEGKTTIKELQGEAKVGTKVRVRIQFESEKVKGAPEEKVHFDVVQELELK